MTFEVGDYVYLKVSLIRGLRRFKVKGKLSPQYIGPFQILEKEGLSGISIEITGTIVKCP